jgi:hypothetical protein
MPIALKWEFTVWGCIFVCRTILYLPWLVINAVVPAGHPPGMSPTSRHLYEVGKPQSVILLTVTVFLQVLAQLLS